MSKLLISILFITLTVLSSNEYFQVPLKTFNIDQFKAHTAILKPLKIIGIQKTTHAFAHRAELIEVTKKYLEQIDIPEYYVEMFNPRPIVRINEPEDGYHFITCEDKSGNLGIKAVAATETNQLLYFIVAHDITRKIYLQPIPK